MQQFLTRLIIGGAWLSAFATTLAASEPPPERTMLAVQQGKRANQDNRRGDSAKIKSLQNQNAKLRRQLSEAQRDLRAARQETARVRKIAEQIAAEAKKIDAQRNKAEDELKKVKAELKKLKESQKDPS